MGLIFKPSGTDVFDERRSTHAQFSRDVGFRGFVGEHFNNLMPESNNCKDAKWR
jgi:hypothetical protein